MIDVDFAVHSQQSAARARLGQLAELFICQLGRIFELQLGINVGVVGVCLPDRARSALLEVTTFKNLKK